MISPEAERIIRSAATAQRAYLVLVNQASENPRWKLELFDRRIAIDAELRGEFPPRPSPAIDMSLSLEADVNRRLEWLRAEVTLEVAQRRAVKRLAGCGYSQLALSYRAEMRRLLKKLLEDSSLSPGEFAAAIGVAQRTVERWLDGAKIPHERAVWLRRVERIHVDRQGRVTITTRAR